MTSRPIVALLTALLVVLAGCSTGVTPDAGGPGEGTVNFYVSDERNAIDQFAHLNVTVSEVVLVRTEAANATGESDGRVAYDVPNVTVDLTELQGANATKVGSLPAENGTYTKVFVHVSQVNATLKNGESATVKLPSNTLQLNTDFTVGSGEEVDFVFDISVVEAGGSGKYVLKPVASQSGPGDRVEIDPVDGSGDAEAAGNASDAGGSKDDAGKSGEKGEKNGKDGNGEKGENDAKDEEGAPNGTASNTASMDFYVSDERNAIDQFAHLNVTVTRVGLHSAGNGSEASWVEYDVNDTTVDLTELQGANATKLDTFPVEPGSYDKVFVYVSDVEGTLEGGERVTVKLPSSKLHVTADFTVGSGEDVDFVFDITVFAAGNSGKYVLKPVVSQSGTGEQVEIDDRDDENGEDDEGDEADLNATFVGDVDPGENATVLVTRNDTAVENATVTVHQEFPDGESKATLETDANGTVTVAVDENATGLSVRVEVGDDEVELEREFEDDGGDDGSGGTEDGDEADLNATFVGDVEPGENVSVAVTRDGDPVANATVEVIQTADGEIAVRSYETDADGTVSFHLDSETAELEVEVESGDDEAELSRTFDANSSDDAASLRVAL